MTYRLMIKTHNTTGLKYLCITSRDKWEKYVGSGVRWLRHLKKHGKDISTKLLFECDEYDAFVEKCLFYSELYQVDTSDEFANLVPEGGYCGNGMPNVVAWWQNATDDDRRLVREKAGDGIAKAWANMTPDERESRRIAGVITGKENWDGQSLEFKEELKVATGVGREKFHREKGERYDKWKAGLRTGQKRYHENVPFDVLSEKNRKQRLAISPENARRRKEKIQAVYATGKHDALHERMSVERSGAGNPMARMTLWDGVEYTKGQFKKFTRDSGFDQQWVEDQLSSDNQERKRLYVETVIIYDTLVCPHCSKESKGHHGGFKRWHFDNCREKK